jgi:hypothetical protein
MGNSAEDPSTWEGTALERASLRWPPAIHRRLASALRHRTRKSWAYHPWQKTMAMDERHAELAEVAAVFKTRALVNSADGGAAHTVRDLTPI